MKLAVKLYRDVPKEEKLTGIPDEWPAHVLELPDGAMAPAPYIRMTLDEYRAHCDQHRPTYEKWIKTHDPSGKWRVHWGIPSRMRRVWFKLRGRF